MAWTERYVTPTGAGAHDGSSEANAWSLAEAVSGIADGDSLNLKGSFTPAGAVAFATNGSAAAGIRIRGYTSTIGDRGKADITMNANMFSTGYFYTLTDLYIHGTQANSGSAKLVSLNNMCRAIRCKFVSTNTYNSNPIYTFYGYAGTALIHCYIESASSKSDSCAVYQTGNAGGINGCFVKSAGTGIRIDNQGWATQNVVWGAGLSGSNGIWHVDTGYGSTISGNTIFNFDYGVYEYFATHLTVVNIVNNIIYQMGSYGIYNRENTSTERQCIVNNAMGAITTANTYQCGNQGEVDTIALTGDPFVDSSSGDFRLNNTAGAGAMCRGYGAPVDMNMDGTTDNWRDLGAVQHQDSGGGGAVPIIGGSMIRRAS